MAGGEREVRLGDKRPVDLRRGTGGRLRRGQARQDRGRANGSRAGENGRRMSWLGAEESADST